MQSGLKKYTEANREAWNEVMPRHQKASREKWDHAFMQPGFVCLGDVELDLLRRMGIQGKAVAHLCCNNGVELLSLKNLGAGECVGFDISAGHQRIEQVHAGVPLSYILIEKKNKVPAAVSLLCI